MKPNSSCQSTGVPTRHGSVSKCAPCVESVIRTNGETSRFTPSTEDIAAQTSERLARTGNSTISRILPGCPIRPDLASAERPFWRAVSLLDDGVDPIDIVGVVRSLRPRAIAPTQCQLQGCD